MPRRFWLPVCHATDLTRHILEEQQWTLTADADWDLAWLIDPPSAEHFAMADGRWINHIAGIESLTMKSGLCMTLRAAAARAATVGAEALHRFSPQTFVLPGEWHEWHRARAWDPDTVWIQKPADSSRGRGVELVTGPLGASGATVVIQRYIANPHLLDGFKYTLRFYVLIASVTPLVAYLFDDGFTKLASRPFSLDAAHRDDRFRHLTNPDILRDDPEAQGVSSRNSTHREYRARLAREGINVETLWRRIRRLLAITVASATPYMRATEAVRRNRGRGQFELLGIDVTVDDTLQPWLIECNLAPSLAVEASPSTDASRAEHDIKTRVIGDTLAIIGSDSPPPQPPSTAEEARALLRQLDQRRGGFSRLWPSPEALEGVAGMDFLEPLDVALLSEELPAVPPLVANHLEAWPCGSETVIFDRRRERITLLDALESRGWPSAPAVEWLREGWLLPADAVGANRVEDVATGPHRRLGWNRERVYEVHGMRVAVVSTTARQEEAVDRALAWWSADDVMHVDAVVQVPPRMPAADVVSLVDRHALAHAGGVIRRRLIVATRRDDAVLVTSGQFVGGDDGWAIAHAHVMIGGSPFGAWIDRGGSLAPLSVSAFATDGSSPGDVLLDLTSDGPGVIRSLSADGVRALIEWITRIAILPQARPRI